MGTLTSFIMSTVDGLLLGAGDTLVFGRAHL